MVKESQFSTEFRGSEVKRRTLRVPTYKGTGICRSVVEDPDMGLTMSTPYDSGPTSFRP
jgi:hypothetical protein